MERRSFMSRAALLGAGAAAGSLNLLETADGAQAMGTSVGSLRFSCIVKTINSPYWAIVLSAAKKAAKDLGVQGLKFTGGPTEADIAAEVKLVLAALAVTAPLETGLHTVDRPDEASVHA